MKTMKKGEEHSEFTDRLVSLLAGELSGSDRHALEQEITSDPEKEILYREYRKVWDQVGSEESAPALDMDKEWNLFLGKWENSNKEANKVKVLSLRQVFIRIAAVVLIGLLTFASYRSIDILSATRKYVATNQPELVILPDGSQVTLNRGSVMRAFRKTDGEIRHIKLDGEAFFEVARDTLHPFVIEAGSAVVEVLGTSFNVNAYKENGKVEVTVSTGVVAFSSAKDAERQVVLKAGNSGLYVARDEKLSLVQQADQNALAWVTKKLVFTGSSLAEVVARLNHAYAADIRIDSPGLENCPLTVSFDKQSLSSVIAVLESTLNIRFEKEGDHYIIRGEVCE